MGRTSNFKFSRISYKSKKTIANPPGKWVTFENTHEAIIDMETFQYVQAEMQRRRELGALANKSLNTCCFTGKLKCPFCGQSYMHNTRTDRDNFQEFWSCGNMKKKIV